MHPTCQLVMYNKYCVEIVNCNFFAHSLFSLFIIKILRTVWMDKSAIDTSLLVKEPDVEYNGRVLDVGKMS